jgi:hypothetical protein
MNQKTNGLEPFSMETMTENPVYYTTAYEIRIVKTLCAFIAANGIILLSFPRNRLQARRPRRNSRLHHGDDPELPGFWDNLQEAERPYHSGPGD